MSTLKKIKFLTKKKIPIYILKYLFKRNLPNDIVYGSYFNKGKEHSLKYNKENNCLFIHIPKTGGSSISNSLFGVWPHLHFTDKEFIAIYGAQFYLKAFKFCFVRNPWDRLYSSYCYLQKNLGSEKDIKYGMTLLQNISSFEEFVYLKVNQKRFLYTNFMFYQQCHFISNNLDSVNFIGRYENLKNDFEYVSEKLKRKGCVLLHLNKSNSDDYRLQYNSKMKDIVYKTYKNDIDLFNYEF